MISVSARCGDRKTAAERLLLTWGLAVLPNTLAALGVDLAGGWTVVRYALSGLFTLALVAWLVAIWGERRERS